MRSFVLRTLGSSRSSAVMARLTGNRNYLRDLRCAPSTASGAMLNRPRSGGGGPGFEEDSAGSGYSGQWIAIQVAVHSTAKRDSRARFSARDEDPALPVPPPLMSFLNERPMNQRYQRYRGPAEHQGIATPRCSNKLLFETDLTSRSFVIYFPNSSPTNGYSSDVHHDTSVSTPPCTKYLQAPLTAYRRNRTHERTCRKTHACICADRKPR